MPRNNEHFLQRDKLKKEQIAILKQDTLPMRFFWIDHELQLIFPKLKDEDKDYKNFQFYKRRSFKSMIFLL
jgi:hypothetical protein